jgi:biopolymer transport protein ExbD
MTRRSRPTYAVPADMPLHALNTTPLIDVMLVLLVMMILSIPMMTHRVRIQIPTGDPPVSQIPVIHQLRLEASGAILLDGSAITLQALPGQLSAIKADPTGVLQLSASGEARYESYAELLAVVRRAGIDRLGLVGNEGFVASLDR